MVLVALLAIPASASGGITRYITKTCSCADSTFTAAAESYVGTGATLSYALTELNHRASDSCTSGSVYVSAKFWHYPSASSSAYNTTTLTNSAEGRYVSARVTETASIGEVFCIESNHRVTTVCSGETETYTRYICNGGPAMK